MSLPLQAAGISTLKSFWFGQLSGMVEPVAGVLGAVGVSLAQPALPYALAFAAGAMIYVVIDDIIPEAHSGYVASYLLNTYRNSRRGSDHSVTVCLYQAFNWPAAFFASRCPLLLRPHDPPRVFINLYAGP